MNEYADIPIKQLVLLEKNPRKITKTELDKLCDSLIKDPGFLKSRPVLVNRVDGVLNVYAGNQRVQAAKKLKWKEIYCCIEDNLSEELMNQRILKDNRHAGEFDYDMLANEWDLDTLIDCGFDPEELHIGLEEEPKDKEEDQENSKCPTCGKKMKV